MNASGHLSQASELQEEVLDLAAILIHLHSLLRLARDMDFHLLSRDHDALEDLCSTICVSGDLAARAQRNCREIEKAVGSLRLRMEKKPEPGDRIPGEELSVMFETLISRGEGCTVHGLSRLATTLGAYAQHDATLKSALDIWIRWMNSLGIEIAIDKSVEQGSGEFSIRIVSAPGGPDAVIRTTSA